ncbi:MAG: terpene cyclase/mutase family protein [Gemmataceae bacterium]|nr:terpene cyclase/mutase family protein [Gemmataceae bacterium]
MRILLGSLLALVCFATSVQTADPPQGKAVMDEAIDNALRALQRQQERDGSWTGGPAKNPAITSLCVMAYLSAGHVPGEGRYGDTVKKGVEYVLAQQHPNGLIATEGNHELYHHGICTLMLAEVAGMTDDKLGKEVRAKLEKAVEVILKAQRTQGIHMGGWRYRITTLDSDISVTGWQIMALRAAKNLGCDVPAEAIDLAVEYIKRCQDSTTGGFRYMPNSRVTVPCTGTSILALEICGKHQHHSPEAVKAGGYLLKNPPKWGSLHFFYGIYYCSQAAFQLGGNYWNDFRPKMHKELLDNQSRTGMWQGADAEGRTYGANYSTAMAVLAMTVEYRFLPIYQRGEEPTEK